ncbi:hypothetical protein EV644_107189 [Kribbella orskensis]|uniref:Uncharacterized protein n=1 Tax=Kribbella orskensis TaxID=2512216 RepID=A0ABY2BLH2_9ACTN|nr:MULTISPECIES: hypothetical protein [Kribbella]TCN39220.1 hypothetical protein EV642_107189 [Kribbella sp. VKM Ac-2500]TCO21867.1 hypothetical protein EV644_107189 [Kribbella orskensis]
MYATPQPHPYAEPAPHQYSGAPYAALVPQPHPYAGPEVHPAEPTAERRKISRAARRRVHARERRVRRTRGQLPTYRPAW